MFFTLTVMTDVQYTLHHIFSRLFCVLAKNATGMLQFTEEKQKDGNTAKRTQFDAEKVFPFFFILNLNPDILGWKMAQSNPQ